MAEKKPKKEEKEFKCEVCGKAFSKKIALTGHKRTHGEEKKKIKKETKYPGWIFFFAVVLIVGVGIGYYLFTPKEAETAPPTTTLIGEVVTAGKIVKVDYIGKFENGTVFDTSLEEEAELAGIYQEGRPYEPFSFAVGKGQAIEGFEEAVLGMKVGEEIEVTIPPEKAYSSGPLAGKTLIFKIWVREIKEPLKVELTIVNDPDCGAECDTLRILGITEGVFPGVEVTEVDSNSEEGKALIEKYDILLLPAYILSENIVEAENYESNAMAFEKKGDGYMLRVDLSGATHYLSEEARIAAEKAELEARALAVGLPKNATLEEIEAAEERAKPKTTLGNFLEKNEDICKEDDQVLVYLFGSNRCSHCGWLHPILVNVTKKFGEYVSFHDNIDADDDQDVYAKFGTGYIPLTIIGCRYYRTGAHHERETDGAQIEAREITALICSLTNNKPSALCSEVEDLLKEI